MSGDERERTTGAVRTRPNGRIKPHPATILQTAGFRSVFHANACIRALALADGDAAAYVTRPRLLRERKIAVLPVVSLLSTARQTLARACLALATVAGWLASAAVHATTAPVRGAAAATAAATPPAAGSLLGELVAILFPLALVVLLLLAILFGVRRRFGLSSRDAPVSVLQILPLGPRERMVLVKTRAGRVLALGVSGQSVAYLTELTAQDVAVPAADSDRESDAALRDADGPAIHPHWAMALARRMQRR